MINDETAADTIVFRTDPYGEGQIRRSRGAATCENTENRCQANKHNAILADRRLRGEDRRNAGAISLQQEATQDRQDETDARCLLQEDLKAKDVHGHGSDEHQTHERPAADK